MVYLLRCHGFGSHYQKTRTRFARDRHPVLELASSGAAELGEKIMQSQLIIFVRQLSLLYFLCLGRSLMSFERPNFVLVLSTSMKKSS